jgi:hypothetical protein
MTVDRIEEHRYRKIVGGDAIKVGESCLYSLRSWILQGGAKNVEVGAENTFISYKVSFFMIVRAKNLVQKPMVFRGIPDCNMPTW